MEVARGCVIELHGVDGTPVVFLNYLVQVKTNFHVYKDRRGLQRQAVQEIPCIAFICRHTFQWYLSYYPLYKSRDSASFDYLNESYLPTRTHSFWKIPSRFSLKF